MAVRGLAVSYEGVVAGLRGVTLEVAEGSVLAVLGGNGAGKTTLLRTISGLLGYHRGVVTKGSIELDGTPVHRLEPAALVRLGIGHVMEGGRLFPRLTVAENLAAGALSRSRSEEAANREQVLELFPLLAERAASPAGSLSGGQQQLLAVGRALMASPRLLLLDEPGRGLAPPLLQQLHDAIAGLKASGTTVVLVEQHAAGALSLADAAVVLEDGAVRLAGSAAALRQDPDVRRSYLGDRTPEAQGQAPAADRPHVSRSADVAVEVEDVALRFGAVTALEDVSFSVARDEVVAVIGPNGAGKTSLLNCLNGAYVPQRGSIRLHGRELLGRRPAEVAAMGVARAFQAPTAFASLTVLDSLMLGRHRLMRAGSFATAVRTRRARAEEAAHRGRCVELAAGLGLDRWLTRRVAGLPYGVQKRMELARALAMEPSLLLIDEPASGVSAAEIDDMVEALLAVRARRELAVIIVEHDLRLVASVADRVVVMDAGRVISVGSPAAVRADPAVVTAYLGEPRAAVGAGGR